MSRVTVSYFCRCFLAGEFILLKSTATERQVQARYSHFTDRFSEGNAWSVTKGVAIRDKGDSPVVQINIPELSTSSALNTVSDLNCPVHFFVDNTEEDLLLGSGNDNVVVTLTSDNEIEVKYPATDFKVVVSFGFAGSSCFINAAVHVADDEKMMGLLGSSDGDVSNDVRNSCLCEVFPF